VPLVSAAVRALRDDWYPIGDNAFFPLRARDVFTEHHPLLGTWTSASLTVGTDINNPGPLLFDVLAVPARFDVAAGTVIGVVALHAFAVGLAVWWAHRLAGVTGAWAIATAFVALEWAMGSEILVEPWQPHSLLPALLALLVLVWAMVAGQAAALPWAAGLASLILQTHLSYALLVPLLAVLGVVGLVTTAVRRHGWPAARERLRTPAVVALLVLATAWVQPLAEQVAGDGNLGKVITERSGEGPVAGAEFSARIMASVAASPAGWGPGGFERMQTEIEAGRPAEPRLEVTDLGDAAPWLLVLTAAGVVAIMRVRRRRDRTWGSALVVAGVAMAGAFVTVALLPISTILGVAAHQVRFVWPVTLFALVTIAGALVAGAPRARVALPVAAIALMLAAVPAHNPHTGPSADSWAIPVVRDLLPQMDEVDGRGPVFVDVGGIRFAEPYSTPVLLELQRRGVEFVVDDEQISVGQVSPTRERGGAVVDLELRIVEGDAAIVPEPGWERIAYVAGLTADEERELDELDARVASGEDLSREEAGRRADLEHQHSFETAAVLVRDVR
jgi:hypothetical protein